MTADREALPAAPRALRPPMEAEEEAPVPGFAEKLIRWLGRFHPPATHFPIALLVAAALAELLGTVTRRPCFESAVRYCLWFGAGGALVSGLLGWFLGGIALADRSPILAVHRWVGTAAALGACLVLVLGEKGGRGSNERGIRLVFQLCLFTIALLVLVAGFLGGGMIYGLHYHEWR